MIQPKEQKQSKEEAEAEQALKDKAELSRTVTADTLEPQQEETPSFSWFNYPRIRKQ